MVAAKVYCKDVPMAAMTVEMVAQKVVQMV